MECLLGIDVGTSGVRAALFDGGGARISEASTPCGYDAPRPGWAQADPEAWWRAVCQSLKQLDGLASREVAAVAVVGQAPTAVLVDDAGHAIGPAILWLDTRADLEAHELGTRAYYLGPKLAWLARHDAASLARTRHVLQSHAFVAYRLTNRVATDPSTAALALPLFDASTCAWSHAAARAIGLRPEQLPPICRAKDILGRVTAEAARATGLRAGTPVVAGGGDFAAATLGAAVVAEGEACLMLGTAGNLLVPVRAPGTDPRLIHAHHVGVDTWLSLGGTLSGGAQEWLRHALARSAMVTDDTAVRGALPSFDVLDAEATPIDTGSGGLLFLPYLQGERTPLWDVNARGAYVGLGLEHGRGHLWRALLEGIALSFVDCQAVLEESGTRLRNVVAANGGGRSALFRQILCDALGVPLAYAPHAGGTVAGAALLAGLGVGLIEGPEAARAWRGPVVEHVPDLARTARFRELLAWRREAYAGLRGVFHALGRK